MPRKRITEDTVYTFDELSDSAKERARDWYRQGDDDFNDFYGTTVIDDCARIANMIGIDMHRKTVKLMGGGTRQDPEVYYSGFSSQGDGASYSANYSYRKGGLTALRAEAPRGDEKTHKLNNEINRIAEELQKIQRFHFYKLQATVRAGRGHYYHSRTMDIDVECEHCHVSTLHANEDDSDRVAELLRDVADWIYRSLETEYEYQNSDEVVDETIRANEYEFSEDGKRI